MVEIGIKVRAGHGAVGVFLFGVRCFEGDYSVQVGSHAGCMDTASIKVSRELAEKLGPLVGKYIALAFWEIDQ